MENIIFNQEEALDLQDKRLNKRYKKIVEEALKQPSHSIPAIFRNWHQLKAVYRFFDNPKVTAEKLLKHQYETTVKHIQAIDDQKDILLLQDTTDLNDFVASLKNKE